MEKIVQLCYKLLLIMTLLRRIYQYLSLTGETLSVIRLSTEKLKIALNYFLDVNYCILCLFSGKGHFPLCV